MADDRLAWFTSFDQRTCLDTEGLHVFFTARKSASWARQALLFLESELLDIYPSITEYPFLMRFRTERNCQPLNAITTAHNECSWNGSVHIQPCKSFNHRILPFFICTILTNRALICKGARFQGRNDIQTTKPVFF